MKLSKIIGVGLTAALAAGALTAAPSAGTPRAEAAVVAPVVATAIKAPRVDLSRWIDKSAWPARTVAMGKTATFTVKASGGSLKYQWYVVDPSGAHRHKVSGKSARTKTLKIKLTTKNRGKLFNAKVWNSKGVAWSGMFVLFEKRGNVSKVKYGQSGLVGKFRVTPWSRVRFSYGASANTSMVVQNASKSKAKPGATLRFAYRAPNGKLYPNTTRTIWRWIGAKSVTLRSGGYFQVDYLSARGLPRPVEAAKGGHWVVWSTSDPKHKMVLISPQKW